MNVITKSIDLGGGYVVSIETGKLAKQADGSVVLRVGGNMLLATVVAKREINPEVDFLPLTVEYQEKYSSTGKFPGGFFKKEGRLNESEILTSRIIDRSLRPLFPEDYHAEMQVMVSLISSDRQEQPDALATVAASAAIIASDIPFQDPVSSVRVARINGEFVLNPKFNQMSNCDLDLMVSGTNDSINMVEGEMREVSEAVMLQALQFAHPYIQKLNGLQLEIREALNLTTREYAKHEFDQVLFDKIKAIVESDIKTVASSASSKDKRGEAFSEIKKKALATLIEEDETFNRVFEFKQYYYEIEKETVRQLILKGIRLDGRKTDEIRPIWAEVSYLPYAHGSAVFTRGETQSLASVTLGSKLSEQTIDTAIFDTKKTFLLHYSFPAFSTGEVKPNRGPSRREIGHGNLAERSLKNMIPDNNEYTIRVNSEILESNGSSSMASVCAGTLSLMDAGIKIKAPVSGIAMGLITDGKNFAVLSDILGDEDHLGDMDFKVTGTAKGITACQMDIKVRGLSMEIMEQALEQARKGREHILAKMLEALGSPREDLSVYAPRIEKLIIPQNTIGAVIGTGGKVIQEIQRVTGTEIHIEEIDNKGVVTISSPDGVALAAAVKWVKSLTAQPEVGEIYKGVVRGIKDPGAFVEILPGKDGYLHISEVCHRRLEKIEDEIKMGDEFDVKVISVDEKTGKLKVSRKALLPKPEGTPENSEHREKKPYKPHNKK